ncbi:Cellulose synthase-like protein E2 [Camellia lanceoleosa]|uniref:Cellulose synthase-like protein E2 n=1 Tax=Camellia lanceoleosa TaxID=1840588 RepID=A0ACC0G1E1_9ERIC|nr:Cellulose synthase-like protein E2 [Camellia lanceoleosa]
MISSVVSLTGMVSALGLGSLSISVMVSTVELVVFVWVEPRSPAAYFSQNFNKQDPKLTEEWLATKKLYEDMKFRIEAATEKDQCIDVFGSICARCCDYGSAAAIYSKENLMNNDLAAIPSEFPRKLSAVDDDGHQLPTLVYLAREKRPQCPHNFKAGSMNALCPHKEALADYEFRVGIKVRWKYRVDLCVSQATLVE